jgi:adenine-specific DNA-methyltransferase
MACRCATLPRRSDDDEDRVIKYLGSKRVLVDAIVASIEAALGASRRHTVVDLFSGTSRVGIALRKRGFRVIANDHNAYAATIARCYLESSIETHGRDARLLVDELNRLPGRAGYFTETYSLRSRYVHPHNGARVDAIRDAIAAKSLDPVLEAVALTSLLEATDRVDSTCGVQMAFLKEWAARAHRPIELRVPDLLSLDEGPPGQALHMDALDAAQTVEADLAYLDPPYNQHSYLGNYHVWETLTLWDKPDVYGLACKRIDVRERKSVFNRRPQFHDAFRTLVEAVRARMLAVSFSDEGFLSIDALRALLDARGPVVEHAFEHRRYIGAQIGIFNPSGEKVGTPGKPKNKEHLFVVGPTPHAQVTSSTSRVALPAD